MLLLSSQGHGIKLMEMQTPNDDSIVYRHPEGLSGVDMG